MQIGDLLEVYQLGLRHFDPGELPYSHWCATEVALHLENEPDVCFVAEDDGQLIGFVLVASSYETLEEVAHIEWMAIAPEYQGQGIGKQFLLALQDELLRMGRSEMVADVASDNKSTLDILHKEGFQETVSVVFLKRSVAEPFSVTSRS
jgi:ribosomal protein S18 acetylase RimI-like enzyme